jgi:hypothetical protein
MLMAKSSVESIYIEVAEDNVALLKRIFPCPGSAAVVEESNV